MADRASSRRRGCRRCASSAPGAAIGGNPERGKELFERAAPPVEGFGAWTRQAEVAAFLAAQQYFAKDWMVTAAWQVTRGPASLDTSQVGMPSHVVALLAQASQGTVREAADELVQHDLDLPDEIRSHPAYGGDLAGPGRAACRAARPARCRYRAGRETGVGSTITLARPGPAGPRSRGRCLVRAWPRLRARRRRRRADRASHPS